MNRFSTGNRFAGVGGSLLALAVSIWACQDAPSAESNPPTLDGAIASVLGADSAGERATIHGPDQPLFYLEGVLQNPAAWPTPERDQIDTIIVWRGRAFPELYGSASHRGVIHVLLKESAREWNPFVDLIPPSGFRAIARSEYSADWRLVAEVFPAPDRAGGDFDGDGEVDLARLWVHEEGGKWVLMAYLSSIPDTPVTVYESERPVELGNRPIRAIPPGVHKTDQYYGIGPGPADTTAVVHLPYAAINLGRVESEGTTYLWNRETRRFDAIAMH